MRIRTDGEYAHREETIDPAAERFDCNKAKAVLIACEVSGYVLDGVEEVLEHPDLPPSVRDELAGTILMRRVNVGVPEPSTTIHVD